MYVCIYIAASHKCICKWWQVVNKIKPKQESEEEEDEEEEDEDEEVEQIKKLEMEMNLTANHDYGNKHIIDVQVVQTASPQLLIA